MNNRINASQPRQNKTFRKISWVSGLAAAALMLSACGGGSSDSGSGGPPQPGTYRGTVTFSAKISGQSTSSTSQFVLVATDGSNVTVDVGPNVRFAGRMNGNRFSLTRPAREAIGEYDCTGPLTVEGTITSQVNGRLLLDYTCRKAGRQNERVIISAPWVAR